MAPTQTPPVFTIPIAPCGPHPGGSVTCTEPRPGVYLLTFVSPPDNRMTSAFCDALLAALDVVELGGYAPGVVVTTSGLPKFYSNGLDLGHAVETEGFWEEKLYKLLLRLLTYPLPTVALINGHAFAGGLMLAMHHDYRVMNPSHGFACLNELDMGAVLKPAMSAAFRIKLPAPAYRSLVLEATRFTGPAALEAGLVDAVGGWDETLRLVEERELARRGATGVYGDLKREMYRESVEFLTAEGHRKAEEEAAETMASEDERRKEGRKTVERFLGRGKL